MLAGLHPGLRWADSTLFVQSRYEANAAWAKSVQLAPSVLAPQLASVIDVDPLGDGPANRRDPRRARAVDGREADVASPACGSAGRTISRSCQTRRTDRSTMSSWQPRSLRHRGFVIRCQWDGRARCRCHCHPLRLSPWPAMTPLLTAAEVAAQLRVPVEAIRRRAIRREIPHVRIGQRWIRFTPADVDAIVALFRVEPLERPRASDLPARPPEVYVKPRQRGRDANAHRR